MSYPQYYFNPEASIADAGEYINPWTGELPASQKFCGMKLNMPCGLTQKCNILTFNVNRESCDFNLCDMTRAIKSISASSLLTANKNGALDPVLTPATQDSAEETATIPFL